MVCTHTLQKKPYKLPEPIFIVSDIHLQMNKPKTMQKFMEWMLFASQTAKSIVILGDLFEVWFGDDILTLPEGKALQPLVQFIANITKKVPVYLVVGNRDFLLGAEFFTASGIQKLEDIVLLESSNQRFTLCHGDHLCTNDQAYQKFAAMVRQPEWQTEFLQQPFPERLRMAKSLRDQSETTKEIEGHQAYMDVDELESSKLLENTQCEQLIHGHTHLPGSYLMKNGEYTRWVLPDWEYDESSNRGGYLVIQNGKVEAKNI